MRSNLLKFKQLLCKHKRARVIDTRVVEKDLINQTAISIITYKCPECGKAFEKEYDCSYPYEQSVILEIDGEKMAEIVRYSLRE